MPTDSHDRNPRVLVFDSGVGGLSVVAEIQRQLPGCDLIYASDNAAFPYGTKSEATLIERVDVVLHRLLAREAVDIIVVACNSASTLALPAIRARFSQPIVGVVPAIKPAAALSSTRVIGLLATPGTIARQYTRDLIREFASDCEVISLGSSELVQMAEQHLRAQPLAPGALARILAPLHSHPRGAEMDTLVLACTHFPLLRQELRDVLGETVRLVDSGEAIARRVQHWLATLPLSAGARPVHHEAWFTRDTSEVRALAPALARFGIQDLSVEPVPFADSNNSCIN
ncbi:glutamate racemase [Marinimicrobium sp. C2-29]|uniref:glutamate racemase n=1 Tax=Marinimicrobium sp. C2-29 TaxID=3139825 RepID=UPI003138AE5C